VTIDVGERRACRGLVRARHAGLRRDLLEAPSAEVAEKRVRTVEPAEVEIAESVSVDVAGRDTGTVEEDLVEKGTLLGEAVGEVDAGGGWGDRFEADAVSRCDVQRSEFVGTRPTG